MLTARTSGILELCLDMNESPALPANLRYQVRPEQRHSLQLQVDPSVTPEQANQIVQDYRTAVHEARIPQLDLHVVREVMQQTLASQGATHIPQLEEHTYPRPDTRTAAERKDLLPDDIKIQPQPSFMSAEEEQDYLARLDAKLGPAPFAAPPATLDPKPAALEDERPSFAHLTPRELERQVELLNPQSQHNWLKTHTRVLQAATGEAGGDDNDSIASHDNQHPKPPRKRGATKNLAKQVGDRAVERAREGWSPSAASGRGGDEDELSMLEEAPTSAGRKRARDSDGTYRVKGGRGGAGSGKGKRKRSGEEVGSGGSGKKAKITPQEDDCEREMT
jgi:hypothetical protein